MSAFAYRGMPFRAAAWFCASLLVLSSARALIPGACMTLDAASSAHEQSCCAAQPIACDDGDSDGAATWRAENAPVHCGLCNLAQGLAHPLTSISGPTAPDIVGHLAPSLYVSPPAKDVPTPSAPRDPPLAA